MNKYKINLVTMKDVMSFVSRVGTIKQDVTLRSGNGFAVSAKSMLGAIASLEWDDLYVTSDGDIYSAVEPFIAE